MLFACKGLFAKALYLRGVDSDAVTSIRALIALPCFWAYALWRQRNDVLTRSTPTALLAAATAGVVCYYFGALINFHALTLIDASVERVLLFSYPVFVVAATAAMERKRPDAIVLLAVTLTWVGIFFSVGGFDLGALRRNTAGGLLAILSGLTTGIYFLIAARFTRELGSARFTCYAMTASAAALSVHSLATGAFVPAAHYGAVTWLLLIAIGTVSMALPALMQAEGLRIAGAVRSAVVTTVGPPTTVLLAAWLLGERLNAWQLAGIALIVAGIITLERQRLVSAAAAAD